MISTKILALFLAAFTVGNHVEQTEADNHGTVVDPKHLKGTSTLPRIPRVYDNWIDWENWEPSLDLVEAFPRYRSGYDYDGLMVHVVEFGRHNFRGLAALPEERIAELWKAWEQWTRVMETDADLNNGQGIVLIVDFDGFSLANYASQEALKFALKVLTILARQQKAVKYGFFLNVNFAAESWINLVRPFMGTFLDVFDVYGTRTEKWKPKLLRKVPASQLSPKYGGSQDWKCVPAPGNRC